MDGQYRFLADTFNDHPDLSRAPYIVSVSDIYLLADFNLVQLFLELPSSKLAFLCLPLNLDIRIIRIGNQLRNDVINGKA